MEEKKNKHGFRRVIGILIPLILVCVLVYSSYMLITSLLQYHEADKDYEELGKMIQVVETTAPETTAAAEDTGETAAETQPAFPDFPELAIDFEGLTNANKDFACVIYIPVLELSYPVAYTEDNEKYLTETFDGKRNSSGSIFVDANASRGFTDWRTIVYGHNMKNGGMFGKLKNFSRDDSLAAQYPYFLLYFPDRTEKYRIFSYFVISNQNETMYNPVQTADEYDELVNLCQRSSSYKPQDLEFNFADRPKLVTLSTCYGTGHVNNFVVQGALVETRVN